jgi:hypothetical protein
MKRPMVAFLTQLQLLVQDEILGLKPRSTREPRPGSKQQLGQKRNHRPVPPQNLIRADSRRNRANAAAVLARNPG